MASKLGKILRKTSLGLVAILAAGIVNTYIPSFAAENIPEVTLNTTSAKTRAIIEENFNPDEGRFYLPFSSEKSELGDIHINPFVVPDSSRPNDWRAEDNTTGAIQNRREIVNAFLSQSIVPSLPYIPDYFVCGEFAHAMRAEFSGFQRDLDEASSRNDLIYEDIGVVANRFNLPMYYVGLFAPESPTRPHYFGHAINAVLVGGYVGDWNSWMFIEPQEGREVDLGDWSMPSDLTRVTIALPIYSLNGTDVYGQAGIIEFNPSENLNDFEWGMISTDFVRNAGVGIENPPGEEEPLPIENASEIFLGKNGYPNPFNGRTSIDFGLEKGTRARLSIYDVCGRKIQTLADRFIPAGKYTETWNPGINVPSGNYFFRLETENGFRSGRINYLK